MEQNPYYVIISYWEHPLPLENTWKEQRAAKFVKLCVRLYAADIVFLSLNGGRFTHVQTIAYLEILEITAKYK